MGVLSYVISKLSSKSKKILNESESLIKKRLDVNKALNDG